MVEQDGHGQAGQRVQLRGKYLPGQRADPEEGRTTSVSTFDRTLNPKPYLDLFQPMPG